MNTPDLYLNFNESVRGAGPIKGDICIVDLGDKVEIDEWDYVLRGRRPCIVLKIIGIRVEILPLTKNPAYNTGFGIQIPNSGYKSYPRYDNVMPVNRTKLSVLEGANIITTYGVDTFNSIIDRIADYFKSNDKVFIEKKEDIANVPNNVFKAPFNNKYSMQTTKDIKPPVNNSKAPTFYEPDKIEKPAKSEKQKPKTIKRLEQSQIDNAPPCVKKLIKKYGDSFVLTTVQTMSKTASVEVFGVSCSTNTVIRKYLYSIGVSVINFTEKIAITKELRDKIIEKINDGVPARDIASEFNIGVKNVYNITYSTRHK